MKLVSERSVPVALVALLLVLVALAGLGPVSAWSQTDAQPSAVVPLLVNFSGTLTDANGKPLTGTVGVMFLLYKDQEGGSPLWLETQNVQSDKSGHYTVALGSTKSAGLPTGLFSSGEARWLSVQAQDQAEQPRVLLLSVPYALKALDAETIGGKPTSSFMLAPATSKSAGAGTHSTWAQYAFRISAQRRQLY